MKKLIGIFIYGLAMMAIGVVLTITALANGMSINIPRIEWETWTDCYDLQLNVADGNSPARGSIDAYASK